MTEAAQCQECQAIREQLADAWGEARELQEWSNMIRSEMTETGEPFHEVVSRKFEELREKHSSRYQPLQLPLKLPEPRYPRIADAFQKAFAHQLRTGHNALARRRA
jgi:hypothetical protein